MKTETQNLIVIILGLYAVISLIGLYSLIAFASCPFNLALALVSVTTTPVSILGGFVAGKTMTEKENEIYLQSLENTPIETGEEMETPSEEISDGA